MIIHRLRRSLNKAFTAIREVELDEVLERERMKREVFIIILKILLDNYIININRKKKLCLKKTTQTWRY